MFNGIIKKTGKIKRIYKSNKSYFIEILSDVKFYKNEIGTSVSCSGTCLTLEKVNGNLSRYFLSHETISKTNFKTAKKNDVINLEKSLKYGDRISGHFVQGHIDTTSRIKKIDLVGNSWFINFKLSKRYKKYIIQKGSITINGVSLTISKIFKDGFQVVIIPQTLKFTNLIYLKNKVLVNLEFDVIGKYINSFLK